MESGQRTPHEPSAATTEASFDRRALLSSASLLAMAGGLTASYGTFFVFAGQYLYPDEDPGAWHFVARAVDIPPGGSLAFESPQGVQVVVKRDAAASPGVVALEQFQALSSICPHLGCRVHWEPHNHRFFCPCHNGEFDAEGRPTGGPPKAANQHLAHYPLRIEGELIFLNLPTQTVQTRPLQASLSRASRSPHSGGDWS